MARAVYCSREVDPGTPPPCNKILHDRLERNAYPEGVAFLLVRRTPGGVMFCYRHLSKDFKILLARK